jgi:hypothetical protein
VVRHVDHHLGIPIAGKSAILHAVNPGANELVKRRGPLRVSFLKFLGYLLG